MVAASAKAATKPSHGQRGCSDRAATNSATHRPSAAVAKNLVRRSAASFAVACGSGEPGDDGRRIGSHGNAPSLAGRFREGGWLR